MWLDADGDGAYTSPRALAAHVLERAGTEPAPLIAALNDYDEAVATQAASLLAAAGLDLHSDAFAKALATAPAATRGGFQAYLDAGEGRDTKK